MRFTNPTAEEIDLDEAMTAHADALEHERFVFGSAMILYLAGFPFFIFGSGAFERVGLAMISVALLAMVYHFIVHLGTEKKRKAVKELLEPYLKRKAAPLLQDLREKFADDPTIRFIQEDNGSITVIRKKEGEL